MYRRLGEIVDFYEPRIGARFAAGTTIVKYSLCETRVTQDQFLKMTPVSLHRRSDAFHLYLFSYSIESNPLSIYFVCFFLRIVNRV